MKPLAFFCLLLLLASQAGCEKELKEHKLPPAMKKELAKMKKRQSPEAQAREIHGTIALDPARVLDQPGAAVLFVFLRPEGQEEGPPLAVKRYEVYRLPFDFTIGPADQMIEDLPFEGPLTLSARLDADGRPGARPGDLEGRVTVNPGDRGVTVTLDTLIPPDPSEQVTGTLTLSEALKDKAPEGAVLFLIARKKNSVPGQAPLAVRRIPEPRFPLEFALGQGDVMIPGTRFEGAVEITARLDQDGSVLPQPGDIEGRASARAGDTRVQIVLNTLIEKGS